jgi:hypothetical protein
MRHDWLSTQVGYGRQQTYLDKVLPPENVFTESEENPYQQSAWYIDRYLDDMMASTDVVFDVEKFVTYICGNLYFNVIETDTNLEQTLDVFSAINTNADDAGWTDVFRVRMCEYLGNRNDANEELADRIEIFYGTLEQKMRHALLSMEDILTLYRYILIAKYKLSRDLYLATNASFFDRIFDAENINRKELSLCDLDKITTAYQDVEKLVSDNGTVASLSEPLRDWPEIMLLMFHYRFNGSDEYSSQFLRFAEELNELIERSGAEDRCFFYNLGEKILKDDYDTIMIFMKGRNI